MNIHEYQAKAILRQFGVPVPDGHVCYNSAGAREWAKRLGEGPLSSSGAVVADVPVRDRYAELPQYCFCLVLVNVHGNAPVLILRKQLQPAACKYIGNYL